MPPPPPRLMEELVEEILLRLPPSDPASLVRAALVCKSWCRLVSGAGFRRRFRELHRTPPMLGFILRYAENARFEPTSSFRPPYADIPASLTPIDARHGRVLFQDAVSIDLVVSSPVIEKKWRLEYPDLYDYVDYTMAVLCATPGCDHLDCADGGGPFLVVFVGTDDSVEYIDACVYSSETGAWGEFTSLEDPSSCFVHESGALVGSSLYFRCDLATQILEYNLSTRELSEISLPARCHFPDKILMTTEDGRLGFAVVEEFKLYLWSREDGHAGWVQRRVIELHGLLPFRGLLDMTIVVAAADGVVVVFMTTDDVYYTVDLKSGQARQVCKDSSEPHIIPYVSFYTPCIAVD